MAALAGCWLLGREARTALDPLGPNPVHGIARAGRLCFDRAGTSFREAVLEFDNGARAVCLAPIVAAFAPDGTLRTHQQWVNCEPPVVTWVPEFNDLTYRRVDHSHALCRDALGRAHEFRRAGALAGAAPGSRDAP